MKQATIKIDKKLWVITDNSVTPAKISDLATVAQQFDAITVRGEASENKVQKYLDTIRINGWRVTKEVASYSDYGSVNFHYEFVKSF